MIQHAHDNPTLLGRMQQFHAEAEVGWQSWRNRAEKASRYVHNEQWEAAVLEIMQLQGRMALTINKIRAIVNYIAGVERQHRRDLTALNRKGGSDAIARVLTELGRHSRDLCGGQFEQSDAFVIGLICAKSWAQLEINKHRDPFSGDLDTIFRHPFDVLEDPNIQQYDLRDAKYIELSEWIDKESIDLEYPQAARHYQASSNAITPIDEVVSYLLDDHAESDLYSAGDLRDPSKRRYRVRKTWWREPVKRTIAYDRRTEDYRILDPGKDAKAIDRIKQAAGQAPQAIKLAENQVVQRINCTTWMDGVVLRDQRDVMQGLDFMPMFRFCPYWDQHKLDGLVDALIDPQDEINKRRSAAVEHIKRTANSGYMVGNANDPKAKRELEQNAAKPGYIIDKSKFGGSVEPPPIPPMPEGLVRMEERADDDLHTISAVNRENVGRDPGRQQSGYLHELQERSGLTANEIVFDNYDRFLGALGHGTIEMIRRFDIYTQDEIVRIVDDRDLYDPDHLQQAYDEIERIAPRPMLDPVAMAGLDEQTAAIVTARAARDLQAWQEQYEPIARARAMELLVEEMKQWATGRYGIVISQSMHTPTARAANAAMLDQIAQRYPAAVPPRFFIKHSTLPQGVREELIDELDAATQGAA